MLRAAAQSLGYAESDPTLGAQIDRAWAQLERWALRQGPRAERAARKAVEGFESSAARDRQRQN